MSVSVFVNPVSIQVMPGSGWVRFEIYRTGKMDFPAGFYGMEESAKSWRLPAQIKKIATKLQEHDVVEKFHVTLRDKDTGFISVKLRGAVADRSLVHSIADIISIALH